MTDYEELSPRELNKYNRRDKQFRKKTKPVRSFLDEDPIVDISIFNETLEYLQVSNKTLRNCRFINCNLHHSVFEGARLTDCHFIDCNLAYANFNNCSVKEVSFKNSNLPRSSFQRAILILSDFINTNLSKSKLGKSSIENCRFDGANFSQARLIDSVLDNCNLSFGRFIETNFSGSSLSNCRIFGAAVWKCITKNSEQTDLVISPTSESSIRVDNIEAAQSLYMFMTNPKITDFINTYTKTLVLILGRFTKDRKQVLDSIKGAIKSYGVVPVIFDFEKPASRSLIETISLMAHLSFFIVVDISDPRSVGDELRAIAPNLPSVNIFPIQERNSETFGTFSALEGYPWVKPIFEYEHAVEAIEYVNGRISELKS